MKYNQIKWKFGLSKDDYRFLINLQNNKCAICGKELDGFRKTHIDHCHNTGNIRGILCVNCNTMLGLCGEKIYILNNAVRYISENKGIKDFKYRLNRK